MRLYNDVIQESQLVYGDHTQHLNINIIKGKHAWDRQAHGSVVILGENASIVESFIYGN